MEYIFYYTNLCYYLASFYGNYRLSHRLPSWCQTGSVKKWWKKNNYGSSDCNFIAAVYYML